MKNRNWPERFTPLAQLVQEEKRLSRSCGCSAFRALAWLVVVLASLTIGFNFGLRQAPTNLNFNQSAAYQQKILGWVPPALGLKHKTRNLNLKEKSNG